MKILLAPLDPVHDAGLKLIRRKLEALGYRCVLLPPDITVEEIEKLPDGTYWWNMGSWVIDRGAMNWFDPVAGWHVWGCNLAFADGHAEKYTWKDQRTKNWIQGDAQKGPSRIEHKGNPDLEYMLSHFPYKKTN